MKIVVLGNVCLEKKDIQALEQLGDLHIYPGSYTDEKEISSLIDDADILVSELIKLTKPILDNASNLKFITLATTGFDDVDLDAAQQNNITVCYTPGYATEAVAEHTIGLMLAAARLSVMASHDLRKGFYDPCMYQGKELKNKILGIIGYGRIGKRVAEIAQGGFTMKVLFTDKNSSRADLETLLQASDFISLHVPLTKETRNMISEKEFSLMKKGAVLINTARGGIVDEQALIAHLNKGDLFAAGLDVLTNEPMDKHDPILSYLRITVTPHIAYNTDHALEERSKIVVENIKKYLEGKPQNAICTP